MPDEETLVTRPVRVETVFRDYYTRPVVRYSAGWFQTWRGREFFV